MASLDAARRLQHHQQNFLWVYPSPLLRLMSSCVGRLAPHLALAPFPVEWHGACSRPQPLLLQTPRRLRCNGPLFPPPGVDDVGNVAFNQLESKIMVNQTGQGDALPPTIETCVLEPTHGQTTQVTCKVNDVSWRGGPSRSRFA